MRLFLVMVFIAMLALSCVSILPTSKSSAGKCGVLEFRTGPTFQDRVVPVHYYVPVVGAREQMPFQIVLHGASRNAGEYISCWYDKADEYGLVVIAPEFDRNQFTIGEYTQGRLLGADKRIRPAEETLFALLDQIFAFAKAELDLPQAQYNLFGHSAGAQFVHRSLQFYDSPLLGKAVAANPGWYTFPDGDVAYPYGIGSLFEDEVSLRARYYAKDMLILLGTADTLRTTNMRTTPEADRQGLNRLERGRNFFTLNQARAQAEGQPFRWTLDHVPDAGHEHWHMSAAAADILYGKE